MEIIIAIIIIYGIFAIIGAFFSWVGKINVKTIGEFGKFLSRCPSCEDGKLIGRKGPHGSFIGCSKFPKCRYTENVKTAKKEYKKDIEEQLIKDIKKAYT